MDENQNSLPPTQPAPEVSPIVTPQPFSPGPIKPVTKFSAKAIISTLVFLLLAGGAAAGYVYKGQIVKLMAKPTPTPIITTKVSPTPSPTPDRKIYQGDGYTLEYPTAWHVIEKTQIKKCTIVSNVIDPNSGTEDVTQISTFTICLNDGVAPTSLPPSGGGEGENTTTHKVLIDGHSGIRGYVASSYGGADVLEIGLSSAQHLSLELFGNDKVTMEQILSTFKFSSTSLIDCGTETINSTFGGFITPTITPVLNTHTKLQCFVNAAKTCESAKLTIDGTFTITTPVFTEGTISGTDYYKISKGENNTCILDIKGGQYSRTFTGASSDENKKINLEKVKKLINAEGKCIFENSNDIAGSFRDFVGDVYAPLHAPEDVWKEKAECNGVYFEVLE